MPTDITTIASIGSCRSSILSALVGRHGHHNLQVVKKLNNNMVSHIILHSTYPIQRSTHFRMYRLHTHTHCSAVLHSRVAQYSTSTKIDPEILNSTDESSVRSVCQYHDTDTRILHNTKILITIILRRRISFLLMVQISTIYIHAYIYHISNNK